MSENKIKVLIYGASGKMGKSNIITIEKDPEITVCGAIESQNNPNIGKDIGEICGIGRKNINISSDLNNMITECDVVADFTNPEATIKALETNKESRKAFVIGTTGLNNEQNNFVKEMSKIFPIVYAPNFSIGVNVLFKLVEFASKMLNVKLGYDLEIIEAHHKYKKDAPSGTAMKLLDIASKNSGRTVEDAIYGRKGIIGERKINEIGMSVIRAGDIVGEHTVLYSTDGERLELTHKAHSRETLSKGAMMAIKFVHKKEKGLFTMSDVLGL